MVNDVLSSDQEAPTTPQPGKPLTPQGEYLFGVDPMFSLEDVAGDPGVDPSAVSHPETHSPAKPLRSRPFSSRTLVAGTYLALNRSFGVSSAIC